MTSYQDALVLFALLLKFDKKCFNRLCFKNLFLRLSLCICVIAQSVVNIQHSIGCLVVFCLQKVNKSSVRTFRRFFLVFLFFDVPQYSNRFDYIKTYDQQFTLTTKKSLRHL